MNTWGAPLCNQCDSEMQEGDFHSHFQSRAHYQAEWFKVIDQAQNGAAGLINKQLMTAA